MPPTFEVGDIAILQNLVGNSEYNGTEAEVIGGLESRTVYSIISKTSVTIDCYEVRFCADPSIEIAALWYQLRKKRPPNSDKAKEEVIPWSECIFKPVALRKKKEISND